MPDTSLIVLVGAFAGGFVGVPAGAAGGHGFAALRQAGATTAGTGTELIFPALARPAR